MKVYLEDFHAEAFGLEPAEMGFLWAMWMTAWTAGASLSGDMEELRESLEYWFPKVHGRTFNAYVPRLLERHFRLGDDGRYRNERLSRRYETDLKRVRNAIENATKRNADSNENKDLPDSIAYADLGPRTQPNKKDFLEKDLSKKEGEAAAAHGGPDGFAKRLGDGSEIVVSDLLIACETERQRFRYG